MIKDIFKSREALLYVMAISMVFSFSAWRSLLNNFAFEMVKFGGSQIGILQSLREVPGFLAFTVIIVIMFMAQQRLAYLSMMALGLGVILTGYYPSVLGLYVTTIIMSTGFHYLETLRQSLALQWLSKDKAPLVLGKIIAASSFTSLIVFVLIFIMMKFYSVEYKYVYTFFGGVTFVCGVLAWIFFEHFNDSVVQEKKIVLKKEYWLFYILTLFAGARRQIFIVFATFLLVEKFGVKVHNMMALFFINAILTMCLAPIIGKVVSKFGERITLRFEYIGLMLVFTSYAYVQNVYMAYFLYIIDHLLFSMAIALKTYFQKIANPKDIASASAVSFTINHIAAVFLPALLGMLWLYSSSLVFIIGSCIAVSSFLLSFLVPKTPKQGFETTFKKEKL